ncbi:MAG: ATPase domain-containing protein [Bacteroidota bacterium]
MTAASSAPAPSGIAAVDRTWGGLRPGASVLLVGRAASGRTAMALQTVRAAIAAGQTALLLSPRSPADLNTAAQSSGFDLAALHASGRLRVLRIPSAKDLAAKGNDGLRAAYRDLAGLATKAGAHRVVIEDLTPLVQFTTFEAFGAALDELRQSLGEAALVVGLGEPANGPSRELVGVVRARVDGTVRVAGDRVQFDPTPEPSPDPTFAEIPPPPMAASVRQEPLPSPPEPVAVAPQPVVPRMETPYAAGPQDVPPMAPPASATQTPVVPERVVPEPVVPEPAAMPPFGSLGAPPAGFDAQEVEPTEPVLPAFDPPPFSSDGASVSIDTPEPTGHDLDFAPEMPTPPGTPRLPGVAFPAAETEAEASDFPQAGVEPALPPDPELMAPSSDAFGRDPGRAFFENGYLVDSRGATSAPISAAPSAPAEYPAPPTPMPPPGMAPTPAPTVPGFTPLSAPSDDDPRAAQTALQAAFNARSQGTPFLVIAARMEPTQPESASFAAVVEGLRKATPANGAFYANVAQLRSLLVLPGATAEAASGVFAGLQQHLQTATGPQAESTLRAVAAITVPDGQPFGTAQELWEYAVSS